MGKNEELKIKVLYNGEEHDASVTVYSQGDASLYLATLEEGKQLLLVTHSINPSHGTINWFPVDINNLELAALIGEGIERSNR